MVDMVQITKLQVAIFIVLSVLLVGGQQLLYDEPIYLIDTTVLTDTQKVTLVTAQLAPMTLIIGWEERMQSGHSLNYVVRQVNRRRLMINSYLLSTGVISFGVLCIGLLQMIMTQQYRIDIRWIGVMLFYIMWHMIQRIIEDRSNSTLGVSIIASMFGFGLFVNIPILQSLLFVFGKLSLLNAWNSVILAIIIFGLGIVLKYAYVKKQVI